MECPCCFEEMEYVTHGNWKCWECGAIVHELAIKGLHYFSDGRVHTKVGLKCVPSVTI